MIKQNALKLFLESVNTGGIIGTILVNSGGSPLTFVGCDEDEAKLLSAIINNMWSVYGQCGKSLFDETQQISMFDCDNGRLIVRSIVSGKLLLCLKAQKNANLGMLKLKAQIIGDHLRDILKVAIDY
ncbi:hypothetical protein GJ496_005173 [Pomphorhynchus laevis]|nr:hypothetical protein GJ496_005173 [Pomphorhynchus laevis]